MKINATEAELHSAAEVLKMAAILDDRVTAADKARVMGWAEQIHRHGLERGDLLDGLQLFYDGPSERAIQIGDLIDRGRIARRARLDKEADEERERRQDELAWKAGGGQMSTLAAAVVMGPSEKRTPRLVAAEEALQCAVDKRSAQAAIREFFEAKTAARNTPGGHAA